MTIKDLSRRELMKWGGAAVASIPLGTLESIISGRKEAASITRSHPSTNMARGPITVDDATSPDESAEKQTG